MSAEQRIEVVEVEVDGFTPVDLYQRREKIFTRFVGGFFQRLRFFTGWPLLVGYYLTPWLQWNDRQAILFDLPARQFHIFGATFWPEDLWLLGWMLIIAAFGLFAVTTVVGRLWCGYTCPQTVWTAIYMWIEQVTEGSRNQRIKLDAAPLSFNKLRRRATKHAMWLVVAFLTGLSFVGYFTPIRTLTVDLFSLDSHGWSLFWVAFFTAATYINAGWLREQVCIYMCPYARFQSAMIENKTLIVSYDPARGEPRGLQKRSVALKAEQLTGRVPTEIGDCIDCSLCVQVCPTGIDIRDGLQYQCIGCAHCIDACNEVMTKLDKPKGLIRYTSEYALQGGQGHWLSGRSIGYMAATAVMVGALMVALFARETVSVEITRDRSTMFNISSEGVVSNSYSFKLINKTDHASDYRIQLSDSAGLTLERASALTLGPRQSETRTIRIIDKRPDSPAVIGGEPVQFEICATSSIGAEHCVQEQGRFFRPTDNTGYNGGGR
ncbi:MAG: cytochrome c oxidase accessory protein CcoG [Pseudomonadales bacterium]